MNTSEATSIVILAQIIVNHNWAIKNADGNLDRIANINNVTINTIMDNAHNISHRTSSTPVEEGQK